MYIDIHVVVVFTLLPPSPRPFLSRPGRVVLGVDDSPGPWLGGEPGGAQRQVVADPDVPDPRAPRHHPHLPRSANHRRHRQPQGSQVTGNRLQVT